MAHFTKSGGMAYHPYPYHIRIPRIGRSSAPIQEYAGGQWVHNPYHGAWVATKGAGYATAVGAGNFATRNYRQKPIVMLQKANHIKDPVKVLRDKIRDKIKIPLKENKILVTNNPKMVKMSRPSRPKFGRRRTKRKSNRKKYIPLALPRSRVVRFRGVCRGGLSGVSGALNGIAIKANSLNDWSGAFSTSLPLGTDQWAAQYQKYIVLGSKLKVRFIPTTQTGPLNVGLHLADNTTLLANTDHYKELPATSQCIMTTQRDYCTRMIKYSGKKFWKLTNIKDDSEQEATFGLSPGDPTDIAYIHVYCQDLQNSNTATIECQLEMEFIVLLTDPVTLAQSAM